MNGRQTQSADTATTKQKAALVTRSAYVPASSPMPGLMDRFGNQGLQAMFRSAQTANAPLQSPPAPSLMLDTKPGTAEGRGHGLTMDATRSSILPAAADDMTDAELAKQIKNLNAAIEAEPPTSLVSEQHQHNRRLLENAQAFRLVKNTPDAQFADSGPSKMPLIIKWQECADDFNVSYAELVLKAGRFKTAVLTAAYVRLTHNRENLEKWRKFIESEFSAVELQHQTYAQTAADLFTAAQEHGTMQVLPNWSAESNPFKRKVQEDQIHGKNQLCTGCHLTVQADDTESWMYTTYKDVARGGPAWQSPATRLGGMAGFSLPGRRLGGQESMFLVHAAIEQIKPVLAPLGEYGYRILPPDTMSLFANASPWELKAKIYENIDQRRADYLWLQGRIVSGSVKYLDLKAVLNDMLPMTTPDVARAIREEIEFGPSILETVVKTLIEILLMILVPPLGVAFAAAQFLSGFETFIQGHNYLLGTGANDVFTREQQDMAGSLMAGGTVAMAIAGGTLIASTPHAMDWSATQVIKMSDAKLAYELGRRAEAVGFVTEAELLQLARPGLLTRAAHRWTDLRGFQIRYRGQSLDAPIRSPLARTDMQLSDDMYNMLQAQGFTDEQIAGFTARWGGERVPAVGTPAGLDPDLALGGAGIPTTTRLNIAARYAGEGGVIYVLRVPRNLPVAPRFTPGRGALDDVPWELKWQMEAENIIFHEVPGQYVVGQMSGSSFIPLRVKASAGPPTLSIPRVQRVER